MMTVSKDELKNTVWAIWNNTRHVETAKPPLTRSQAIFLLRVIFDLVDPLVDPLVIGKAADDG